MFRLNYINFMHQGFIVGLLLLLLLLLQRQHTLYGVASLPSGISRSDLRFGYYTDEGPLNKCLKY